ncbi:sugar transferase [Kitasatospora sp. NPDC094015]|uniref:sugar transferase n=1 Tax=Kitasatospora sp. NPDC094015 TaxID=3155205 RepID=UPI00332D941A
MRRAGDLAVASLAGAVAVPLGLVIALLIRCTMGGPVIFRQTRTGRDGREFQILKFRTMRDRRFAEEEDAPRITRLGALLRRTSLDELPQLWNVARGDMGIIGPRPTLPEQVVHYSTRQRGRLAVRPGLTGWAQVCGRNSISWPERIELDLWYIEHRSAGLDLKILARTAQQLLRPQGITAAGGVNPGFPVPAEASVQRVVLPRQATGPRLTGLPVRAVEEAS